MKISIFLLFVSFNVISLMNTEESYDFDILIIKLKELGVYEILIDVNDYFGPDVAIGMCDESFPYTHFCEKVIRIYMTPNAPRSPNLRSFLISKKSKEKKTPLTEEQKRENYEILKKIIRSHNIPLLIRKALERVAYKIAKKFTEIFSVETSLFNISKN